MGFIVELGKEHRGIYCGGVKKMWTKYHTSVDLLFLLS